MYNVGGNSLKYNFFGYIFYVSSHGIPSWSVVSVDFGSQNHLAGIASEGRDAPLEANLTL